MAYSAEKKSAGSLDADQSILTSRKKFNQEKLTTEILVKDPESESGFSNVCGITENTSKGQENAEGSGKRKHSRWDVPQADEQNVDDGAAVTKKRRTRWASNDDNSQLRMLGPINLPDLVGSAEDPKVNKLKMQLLGINKKLQNQVSTAEPLNKKLVNQKQRIIMKLVDKNPTFGSSSEFNQQKFYKKLYVPVKEYPEYNFAGLILGPQGRTLQRMEKLTGVTIKLRGKGFSKDSKQKDGNQDSSEEDLYVLLEASSQKSLDAATAMVESLLVPVEDRKNKLKLAQLRELAELNGTLRCENTNKIGELSSKTNDKCGICGDTGHFSVACPLKPSTVPRIDEMSFLCDVSGNVGDFSVAQPFSATLLQTKVHENDARFSAPVGYPPFNCPPFLGNQPLDFRPEVHAMPFGSDKLHRDLDYTNLYVTHLPQYVDVGRLVHLFSPFGVLSDVRVIRDQTTGLSKGYGFVKYIDPTSAAMAVNQMNGYTLDGNVLTVQVAGNEHGAPGAVQSMKHTSICFPPAYPTSITATHIPASACWPASLGSQLPETYPMHTSYGSSFANTVPPSWTSTLNASPEEVARFPGNPDNFASGSSLFS